MTVIRPFVERSIAGADGAKIAVVEWSGTKGPLVCIHGLTSSSRVFAGLATELADFGILAVDCRGRGDSSKEPPFGLAQHAADVASVMDATGIGSATLVGHSMGAYVVEAFCAAHPERAERAVLVDGGYSFGVPDGQKPEEMLESRLGPFVVKMRRTWKNLDEYLGYYATTGLYPDGIDEYGQAHFSHDLAGQEPALRTKVVEACVGPDWLDVLDRQTVEGRLAKMRQPVLVLRAPEGLTGKGDEVVPDEFRDAILKLVPHARFVDISRTNHHTILCSVPGARAVAQEIRRFAA